MSLNGLDWPTDAVERALMESDQKKSFVKGQTGREAPPDVLADEVRRLRLVLAEKEELHRMQLAGISVAASGYWKVGDGIHPDYDCPSLRDVAKLYSKYEAQYKELESINSYLRGRPALDGLNLRQKIEKLLATASAFDPNDKSAGRLVKLEKVLTLADELCVALDNADKDIGGSRSAATILQELGPAVDEALKGRPKRSI